MKKILVYGATIKLSQDDQTGIMKKVFAEAKVFSDRFDVYVWGFDDTDIVYYHNNEMTRVKSFRNKSERREFYFTELTSFAINNNAYAFYFRYSTTDFFLLGMLKRFRKNGIRSVIEIPTYPYRGEFTGTLKRRMIYLLDFVLRGKLHKYVERVVVFTSSEKSIYKIPCINTMNGVDYDSVIQVIHSDPDLSVIKMIAVSSMLPHHGYDRLLKGIKEYNASADDTKVEFYLVGTGPEYDSYKQYVDDNGLSDCVILCGHKIGSELDGLFEKSHVAVGSLGLHRIGLNSGSTLKNREYAARGLPVVYSTSDALLDGKRYVLRVPEDESPVNVSSVVEFVKDLYKIKDVSDFIRNDSYGICDMHVVMKDVADYLK